MKKSVAGFTLIELLVVITIIGILSSVLYLKISEGGALSRDAERKADLRNLQTALELYKNAEGRYPAGCNAAGTWSGQIGSAYPCASGSQYIMDLAPKYIPVLPTDPKLNGASGYLYKTNSERTVYKLVARNTVETEVLNYESDFAACDMLANGSGNFTVTVAAWSACPAGSVPGYITANAESNKCAFAICNVVNQNASCNKAGPYQDLNTYPDCKLANIGSSYAVWGGYGNPNDIVSNNSDEMEVECLTEKIICSMP